MATTPGAAEARIVLRFSVRDTGIGMDEPQLQRLFLPFSQLDASTTRQYGGTGLGLAICRKLVEMMGGTIEARSTPGQGSEFSFTAAFGTLPADAARPPRATSLARQSIRDLRVLVVDDSPNSRDIFRDLLHVLGLRPALAESGEDALAALARARAEDRFDLVLLDWKMPGLDGFETARRIRAMHPPGRGPRLVLVTAYGDDELARRAIAEGFDNCLDKPVSASTLLDAILPVAAGAAQGLRGGAPSSVEAPPALAGHRVLLVEDNELNQLIATELLRDVAGMDVTLAANGEEALERLAAARFDAVLMDVQMPRMDGYEATALIRRRGEFAGLPVIAMTAHAMARDREKCLVAGMNDYVTKPIDPGELFAVLAKWIPDTVPQGVPAAPGAATGAPAAGISFELGLQRCMGRGDLYERVLQRFKETRLGDLDEMRAALATGDLGRIARLAHSEISTAGAIGAEGLAQAARLLEEGLERRDARELSTLVDAFARQHARVRDDLERYLETAAVK